MDRRTLLAYRPSTGADVAKGKKLMENEEPLIERPARNATNDWKCHALAC